MLTINWLRKRKRRLLSKKPGSSSADVTDPRPSSDTKEMRAKARALHRLQAKVCHSFKNATTMKPVA